MAFCIALVFVTAGGMMAARGQTGSTTAAGPNIEQNAPRTIPCPPSECPPQHLARNNCDRSTQFAIKKLWRGAFYRLPREGFRFLAPRRDHSGI